MMAGANDGRHVRLGATCGVTAVVRLPTGEDSTAIVREQIRLNGLSISAARPTRVSGAPLLFVHGLFAAGWMFERWMMHFAERGRVGYALDLRGHGASAPVADLGRVSVSDYIDDALRVTRSLERAVVVGHSMGALIAQRLAELGLASAAVLVAPAPPRGIPLISLRLMARQAKYLPALLRSREMRVERADADAIILNRVPTEERPTLFARLQADSGRAGREILLGAVAIDHRQVRCPMAVVAGDEDRFIPVRVARRVAAKYDASLHILPGRAHLMMQEPQWAAAAAVIGRWLDGL
jgi:pimeloyl-ACP methyl ester carboxylesterase